MESTMKNLIASKAKLLLVISAICVLFVTPLLANQASAQIAPGDDEPNVWGIGDDAEGGVSEGYVTDATNLSEKDPREMASYIINLLLGFLGIIAVVIILVGGFKWMTAGGNEDGVAEAKKWIFSGIIGLVIILASYAIASFVLNQLVQAVKET